MKRIELEVGSKYSRWTIEEEKTQINNRQKYNKSAK